jgi:hypothetical protein
VSELVPEEVARRVWARWATGTPPDEIAAWLARVGYRLSPDEVLMIATRYEQQRDDTYSQADRDPRDE